MLATFGGAPLNHKKPASKGGGPIIKVPSKQRSILQPDHGATVQFTLKNRTEGIKGVPNSLRGNMGCNELRIPDPDPSLWSIF